MATPQKSTTLFVRNGRPNMVVVKYGKLRETLQRRGHREDTLSLPIDALNDTDIAKWVKNGTLEVITQQQFNKLATRQVDVEPGQFLKKPLRNRAPGVPMIAADSDTSRTLTQIADKDVRAAASKGLEWAGDLMSTEEELEDMDFTQEAIYPSHHRGNDEAVRRAMGY